MADQLPTSLQESILAVLAFDAGPGGTTTALHVSSEHFDAPYQEIATQFLDYRRKYGRPPGPAHLDDIFGFGLQVGERASRTRRLVMGLTELWNSGVNVAYIGTRLNDHVRSQTLKAALMRAGEIYQGGGPDNIAEIEQVLHAALRHRAVRMDAGTFLSDTKRTMKFLDRKSTSFDMGIHELDKRGVGAAAGELLLYIGPKNTGKSWFCVHMGRQGLIHRERVVHISLEMDEDRVVGRYMQSVFSAAWKPDPYVVSLFEFDDLRRVTGWKTRRRNPKFAFTDPDVRQVLRGKLNDWGVRLGNIVIKRFPAGYLTVPLLTGYLDYLENEEGFVPTVLIIDSPFNMKLSPTNLRIDLGRTVVDLAGLAVDRHMAVVATTQGQRAAMTAKRVKSTQVAEDITAVFTADTVLTYSQTPAEYRLGLARLKVEHSRNQEKGTEIIITQAYAAGQYALSSAVLSSMYWEKLKLEDDDGTGDADND